MNGCIWFRADQIISVPMRISLLRSPRERRGQRINAQNNLASFTLLGDMDGPTKDTFDFDGENYQEKKKRWWIVD